MSTGSPDPFRVVVPNLGPCSTLRGPWATSGCAKTFLVTETGDWSCHGHPVVREQGCAPYRAQNSLPHQ